MIATATPPKARSGAARWAKKNLFHTPLDALVSIVFGALALYVIYVAIRFVFVTGEWEIIRVNLKQLIVGRWPAAKLGVLAIGVVVLSLWAGMVAGFIVARHILEGVSTTVGSSTSARLIDLGRRFGPILATILLLLLLTDTPGPWMTALAMLVVAASGYFVGRLLGRRFQLVGGRRALWLAFIVIPVAVFAYLTAAVPLAEWEGFFFNITSAIAGIALCFPLGLLLALGRRSKLPLLKAVSIAYIEFVRGAPLFVLLLLANVSLEFFVPAALAPSKVIRAIVTFTLFTAAYLAEIVRGGLQSVPRGQEEAAKALGLSPMKQMSLIVMPQALRNVIPAQIGQFISLFKDTTLAGVALGILDLLGAGTAITQQPDFRGQGLIFETLIFVGFLFWVGSYTMSRESQRLEKKLGVGTR